MQERKNGFTKSLFLGLWQLLNFTRKLFFNVIFILIIVFLFSVFSRETPDTQPQMESALTLDLRGTLVEQKRFVDPMDEIMDEAFDMKQSIPEVLVSDVILAVQNAKEDKRIKAIVLELQYLRNAGINKLEEIGQALDDFKTSGKKVYAVGDYYSQSQYYLASYADEIYLNPMGALVFEGYGRYRLYYKDAIEKIRATAHIFRVGSYKSAVEPFMRNDMSAEAKEANQGWLDALWDKYKTDVASRRNLTPQAFDDSLSSFINKFKASNGDWAEYAKNNGWVDELKTRQELGTYLAEQISKEQGSKPYRSISFDSYLKILKPQFPLPENQHDKVAIVVAKGTIYNGNQPAGDIGGDSTAKLLSKARKDPKVKAVVLRIDSPGGSAFASEIIRQEVEELIAAGKPVVASMSTYAASGGYWIASSASEIWAAPSTLTGSIGIFGMFMTYENTLDYLGINSDGVATTELAGIDVTRPLSDKVKQVIQLSVEQGYQQFISLVANEREMELAQVDQIAQGRVWTGAKAKELGLVDELGGLQDAVEAAASLAELEMYDTKLFEKALSPRQQFIKDLFADAIAFLGIEPPQVHDNKVYQLLKNIISEYDAMSRLNDPRGVYAFCLACQP